MKNSITLSGIEPATFWFVAQYLNHWIEVWVCTLMYTKTPWNERKCAFCVVSWNVIIRAFAFAKSCTAADRLMFLAVSFWMESTQAMAALSAVEYSRFCSVRVKWGWVMSVSRTKERLASPAKWDSLRHDVNRSIPSCHKETGLFAFFRNELKEYHSEYRIFVFGY
jgi:hypothetical protein